VTVFAHAKINLFLRVLGRRADGYHDIDSLVLPISLADTVTVRPHRGGVSCGVRFPDGRPVPFDEPERDLALMAAERWVEAQWMREHGVHVRVTKEIPIAAGLAGGSADAAAVLRGSNELWGNPLRPEQLLEIAAAIGSDVPALLARQAVRVRGRGEVVEPVGVAPMWWVLVPQPFPVSTADAYRWWDEDGGATGPEPEPLLEATRQGRPDELGGMLFNDLEGSVARRHPEVATATERALGAGALGTVMSGSGPTVAALTRDEAHALDLAAALPGSIAVSAPP
jgi:4-diphosphocytidyl-2-C-methyl-D-erythritol kinase